jgi:hypothetical protein
MHQVIKHQLIKSVRVLEPHCWFSWCARVHQTDNDDHALRALGSPEEAAAAGYGRACERAFVEQV